MGTIVETVTVSSSRRVQYVYRQSKGTWRQQLRNGVRIKRIEAGHNGFVVDTVRKHGQPFAKLTDRENYIASGAQTETRRQ